MDEDGNEIEDPDEDPSEDEFLSGSSIGMYESASSGTFSLGIEADDNLEYEVLVCD